MGTRAGVPVPSSQVHFGSVPTTAGPRCWGPGEPAVGPQEDSGDDWLMPARAECWQVLQQDTGKLRGEADQPHPLLWGSLSQPQSLLSIDLLSTKWSSPWCHQAWELGARVDSQCPTGQLQDGLLQQPCPPIPCQGAHHQRQPVLIDNCASCPSSPLPVGQCLPTLLCLLPSP